MWWHLNYNILLILYVDMETWNKWSLKSIRSYLHQDNSSHITLAEKVSSASSLTLQFTQLKLTFARILTFFFLWLASKLQTNKDYCKKKMLADYVFGNKAAASCERGLSTGVFSIFSVLWHSSKQKHCWWDYCENLLLAHSPLVCAVLTGLKKGAAG